jgi:hypothetical protein
MYETAARSEDAANLKWSKVKENGAKAFITFDKGKTCARTAKLHADTTRRLMKQRARTGQTPNVFTYNNPRAF